MILISDCAPVYLEMIRLAKNHYGEERAKTSLPFRIIFLPIEYGLSILPGDISATCHPY